MSKNGQVQLKILQNLLKDFWPSDHFGTLTIKVLKYSKYTKRDHWDVQRNKFLENFLQIPCPNFLKTPLKGCFWKKSLSRGVVRNSYFEKFLVNFWGKHSLRKAAFENSLGISLQLYKIALWLQFFPGNFEEIFRKSISLNTFSKEYLWRAASVLLILHLLIVKF